MRKNLIFKCFCVIGMVYNIHAIDLYDLNNVNLPDTIKDGVFYEYEKRFDVEGTNVLMYDTVGNLKQIKHIDSNGFTDLVNVAFWSYGNTFVIQFSAHGMKEKETISIDQNGRPTERIDYVNDSKISTEKITYSPNGNSSTAEIIYHSDEYSGPKTIKRYYDSKGRITKAFLSGQGYNPDIEILRYTGDYINRIVSYDFYYTYGPGLEKLDGSHREMAFEYIKGSKDKRLNKSKTNFNLNATITSMIIRKLKNKAFYENKK